MKKFLILILLIFTSCGYQPLYKVNKEIDNFKIQEIKLVGDNKISKEIYNSLPFILMENDKSLNKVNISSEKQIIEASKNSKGQVTSYKTILIIKLKILDTKNDIINEKISLKEFSYNTDENKFKLKEYQIKIEKNLINSIIEDMVIHLNYL
tara:strand:- start:2811 stop:3266 length:456 start_codon:yes stop_codon:yes gene_type:complete